MPKVLFETKTHTQSSIYNIKTKDEDETLLSEVLHSYHVLTTVYTSSILGGGGGGGVHSLLLVQYTHPNHSYYVGG